ncbi:MAG TPA: hypothetical protein VGM95_01835 [Lactobacillaceae bacterium]|jgi:ribosomal protein L17
MVPPHDTETAGQRLGWQAKNNARAVMDSLADNKDLTDVAFDEKQKLSAAEGTTCQVVSEEDLQYFANGLLHAIDDFAASHRVTGLVEYQDLHAKIVQDILTLSQENIREISNELKELRALVSRLVVQANENDVNALRAVAADHLAAFAPAATDDTLADVYADLQNGYLSQTLLNAEQWRELILNFTNVLPEFRRLTRIYLFDMMEGIDNLRVKYHLENNAQISELMHEANMLIHVAARPVDFLDVRDKFNEVNVLISQAIVADAPIEDARQYALDILREVENTVATGVQLDEESVDLFNTCVADFKANPDADRDTVRSIVERLKKVTFA